MAYYLRRAAACILSAAVILVFAGCTNRPAGSPDTSGRTSGAATGGTLHNTKAEDSGTAGGADTTTDTQTGTRDGGVNGQTGGGQQHTQTQAIDLEKVKPNEAGKIMVVMFHNFIKEYASGDKDFTTTFDNFRKLLGDLYEKGYRLVSLTNYLKGNIDVPAGFMPMIFTFDDGTAGQFDLVESGGKLVANPESAVGIMEEFNRGHPDFGLKGTFYINLGEGVMFSGKGTLQQRLQYLIDEGFEIGNHTLDHVHLNEITNADKIQQEIGGNQKRMQEIIPGYVMQTFSLPFGQPSESLRGYVAHGEYDGVKYENKAIMLVGAEPASSPASFAFKLPDLPRVRAPGMSDVYMDLGWWLNRLTRSEQYVSDGNPDTVTVPLSQESNIDPAKLGGRKLVTY